MSLAWTSALTVARLPRAGSVAVAGLTVSYTCPGWSSMPG
jgi:hypothetical protein